MIVSLHGLVVPTQEHIDAINGFAELARARANLVRLYGLAPTPGLAARLYAADDALVARYEDMIGRGQGLEAAAVLALHRAPSVRPTLRWRAA